MKCYRCEISHAQYELRPFTMVMNTAASKQEYFCIDCLADIAQKMAGIVCDDGLQIPYYETIKNWLEKR